MKKIVSSRTVKFVNTAIFLLLTVFVFVFVISAAANEQNFGSFEVEVPEDWTVEQMEGQIIFTSPDAFAVVSLAWGDLEGYTLLALAEDMSRELNGSALQSVGGYFMFSFHDGNGGTSTVFVSGNEERGYYLMRIQAGEHPQMNELLGSLRWVEAP